MSNAEDADKDFSTYCPINQSVFFIYIPPAKGTYEEHSGGVHPLIALHHGRKMKSESFASCHGRANISGGSKIA